MLIASLKQQRSVTEVTPYAADVAGPGTSLTSRPQ